MNRLAIALKRLTFPSDVNPILERIPIHSYQIPSAAREHISTYTPLSLHKERSRH